MKFLPPLEIAAKIMTLIEEADKTLIIVSPYVNITAWDKMKKCLDRAVKRGVHITFIARKNAKMDLAPLAELGITPVLVNDLHAKVYINEKYGIVTSLNMVRYSDDNSIDIAYRTENVKERTELVDFVTKYVTDITPKVKTTFYRVAERNFDNKKHLNEYQVEKLYKAFIDSFPRSEFRCTQSYVFSEELLPFADVIIDSQYIIKISKLRTDKEQILKKLEELNYKFLHKFRVQLITDHNSYYYIEFIPQTAIELKKLIEDYVGLTNTILNSDIAKVLRKQRPVWM